VWYHSNSLSPSIAHIIVQTEHAADAIAILRHFGLETLAQRLLEEDGVHSLGNLLSLAPEVYDLFDGLCLWFESTDEVCHL
jgi:hypothetical protein